MNATIKVLEKYLYNHRGKVHAMCVMRKKLVYVFTTTCNMLGDLHGQQHVISHLDNLWL